MTVAITIS